MKIGLIGSVLWIALTGFGANAASAPDLSKLPPPAKQEGVTYSGDIKKIFDTSCVRCHGSEKPKARLQLNTLEGALKGGESGKAIVPGKSAESVLVHSVGMIGNPDYHMPPKGNKANIPPLTRDQVALVRAWIDQGAK